MSTNTTQATTATTDPSAAVPLGQQLQALRTQLTHEASPFALETVTCADGRQVLAYRNAFKTLPDLINAGRAHGAAEFMVYGEDRWTFDRFFAAADAVAGRLQQQWGIQPGQRVAIAMRNRPEWAVALAAIALVGAVPVPINSFGLTHELMANLEDTTPTGLVCDVDRLERIQDRIQGSDLKVLVVDDNASGEWAQWVAPGGPAAAAPALNADDEALILFTSGATSRAKGALSTHRAVCQAMFNLDFIGALAAMSSPAAIGAIMAKKLAPTILTVVPLFHISGLHAQLLAALRHGRKLVFMYRWDAQQALALMQKEKVTQFNGAPSMVQQVLTQPQLHESGVLDNLFGVGVGGGGMHHKLIDLVLEHVPNKMSGIGFGLTESNGVCAGSSGRMFEERPRASGVLSPIIEVRIAGDDGRTLPAGEAGEVWLKGVTMMQGYWGQPEATRSAMQDGWFRTGDIGVLDADGFLSIVDRIKDVINRSGEKVAAAEVESCLLQHPQVLEAAVFALPHEVTGEQVTAVVVAKPETALAAEDVRAFVRAHLASYKVPEMVLVQHEPLQRNPAGKLLKNHIRQAVQHALQSVA